jgi:aminomuconate-semialdehyde/2-hydroxymuconate-6-semialdehyde dehydrogenase
VQRPIYDRFVNAFVEKASGLVVGDPRLRSTDVGALISREHVSKVLGYIELAKEEGGMIKCGGVQTKLDGECAEGYFVDPTVITGLVVGSCVS